MWRQPVSPALSRPTTAAMAPPNGMPQYITLTAVLRRRGGTASAHSAIRLGMAPPSPMPVATRITSRLAKSHTCAVAIENTPNSAVARISTRLRPMRSASRPPSMAPGSRPKVPALKARPICPTDRPNSRAMRGAATPIDCKSSPSSSATMKHRPSVVATPGPASARVRVVLCMTFPCGWREGESGWADIMRSASWRRR